MHFAQCRHNIMQLRLDITFISQLQLTQKRAS